MQCGSHKANASISGALALAHGNFVLTFSSCSQWFKTLRPEQTTETGCNSPKAQGTARSPGEFRAIAQPRNLARAAPQVSLRFSFRSLLDRLAPNPTGTQMGISKRMRLGKDTCKQLCMVQMLKQTSSRIYGEWIPTPAILKSLF